MSPGAALAAAAAGRRARARCRRRSAARLAEPRDSEPVRLVDVRRSRRAVPVGGRRAPRARAPSELPAERLRAGRAGRGASVPLTWSSQPRSASRSASSGSPGPPPRAPDARSPAAGRRPRRAARAPRGRPSPARERHLHQHEVGAAEPVAARVVVEQAPASASARSRAGARAPRGPRRPRAHAGSPARARAPSGRCGQTCGVANRMRVPCRAASRQSSRALRDRRRAVVARRARRASGRRRRTGSLTRASVAALRRRTSATIWR